MQQASFATILAVSALVWTSPALANGDAAAGKAKAIVCSGCHGPDGNSVNPIWPKLAGQHEAYLIKVLKDYRSGVRRNATMKAMARPLSDADIANLAAFYARQVQK
ncbi:MAG: cytochrome c [Pseudomonadota bacterium]